MNGKYRLITVRMNLLDEYDFYINIDPRIQEILQNL
jgi:hypothetical protein